MNNTSKDPNAIEDFQLDWSARIGTDTIASSTWAISPSSGSSPLVKDDDDKTDTTTTVRLSGGVARQTYTVTNHVTLTTSGQEMDHSLRVYIEEA